VPDFHNAADPMAISKSTRLAPASNPARYDRSRGYWRERFSAMLWERPFGSRYRKKANPGLPRSVPRTKGVSGCTSRWPKLEAAAAEPVPAAKLARRKWWSPARFGCTSADALSWRSNGGSEWFRALLNSVICLDISAAISGKDILVTSNDLREASEECDFMSRPQQWTNGNGYRLDPRLPLAAQHPTWEF
jgi:hypothetical protein